MHQHEPPCSLCGCAYGVHRARGEICPPVTAPGTPEPMPSSEDECEEYWGRGSNGWRRYTPETPSDSVVDHPKHYNVGKIEVIDAIEDWKLGFHEGNVVKYVARAKHKGRELEDLQKAAWYLQRRIEQLTEVE